MNVIKTYDINIMREFIDFLSKKNYPCKSTK